MQLPSSLRDNLVEGLDGYLGNYSGTPDSEAVANFVADELEVWADDAGVEDVVIQLEESGALDTDFLEALEAEMSSNDEFEFTGEEVVSLIERLCDVVWVADAEFGDDLTEDDGLGEDD